MPHFVVDCSESVLEMIDPSELMPSIFDTSASTELFALTGAGGIKVRLRPCAHFLNVERREHFLHVFANIMQGRTPEQKKLLSHRIVEQLQRLLPDVEIISMNVREFEKATYCNTTMVPGM